MPRTASWCAMRLRETGRPCDLHFVRDGEELFDYFRHRANMSTGGARLGPT